MILWCVAFSSKITRKQLKSLLDELSQIRGRHTELVTVYVPSGYNINEIKTLITNEQGTATNIKSKTTKKNVVNSLEKVGQKLKLYNLTPENGLILFCGNISEKEGQPDLKIWDFEPPEQITTRIYRCDQTFVLDPLADMVREKEIYGLITIDSTEASIAFLRGKSIARFKHLTSMVPGKTGKGGQSAARYSRVRDGLLLTFQKEVGALATKTFENEKDLIGIIIGGPGPIKELFFNGEFLSEYIKKKVLGIKDLGYSGDDGLKELIYRSEDLLKDSSVMREKKILVKFFEHLKKETGLVTYGYHEVLRALESGAVNKLIVSEDFCLEHYEIKCDCGYFDDEVAREDSISKTCPKCGATLNIERKNIFKELEKMCEETSCEMTTVSSDTSEGAQFLQLGGIGGMLRFKIE